MKKAIKNFIFDIKSIFFKFIHQENFWKKFAFVYGVYFVGILSLLQANYLYKTDLSRVAALPSFGAWDWGHSGRFFNDLMILIFHFDTYPQDISPLSQLLAIAVLSFASMILVYIVCPKTTRWRLFFSAIVGLSPYYMQVLSYVFDCLFYSIGVFMAVLPFLWYKRNRAFYLISSVCLLLCYMIFQSTISIYMVIAAYMFWNDYQNEKIPLRKLIGKVLKTVALFFGISALYYFMIHFSFADNSVALKQSAICSWKECPAVFAENFHHATMRYFFWHWKHTPMGYAFLGVLLSFLIYVLRKAFQNKRANPRALHIFIALSTMLLMLFFIILWTMFFTFIYWNARIWVAFGICFALMMLATTNEKNKVFRRFFMITSFILMWGCIVFDNRIGNLIEIQKNYETYQFTTLSQELMRFPDKDIVWRGKTIHSPIIRNKSKRYPILGDLVTGMQTYFVRIYDYFFGFYRPDLKRCRNSKEKYRKILLKNKHHQLTEINDRCIEVDIY